MAQNTAGTRRVLSTPQIYNLLQTLVSSNSNRQSFANEILGIENGMKILDIGSGTSEMLAYFPFDIEYHGYDISSEYINFAKNKYQDRNAFFYDRLFDEKEINTLPKFNLVYAGGLLHHIDDHEVNKLFSLASKVLEPEGKFISIDPCFIKNQNKISRYLIKNDRGQNIRTISELKSLALPHFSKVVATHRNDFLRIPYDHAILKCQN